MKRTENGQDEECTRKPDDNKRQTNNAIQQQRVKHTTKPIHIKWQNQRNARHNEAKELCGKEC